MVRALIGAQDRVGDRQLGTDGYCVVPFEKPTVTRGAARVHRRHGLQANQGVLHGPGVEMTIEGGAVGPAGRKRDVTTVEVGVVDGAREEVVVLDTVVMDVGQIRVLHEKVARTGTHGDAVAVVEDSWGKACGSFTAR